ncbi:MAG TPA: hypothetical protein VHO50_09050 [Bacteroidales bacterium]|nr:hypothetical protein [Bacteroidales bacterium]
MRLAALFLFCLYLWPAKAGGQESESIADNFFVEVRSMAFIKNNEYFNPLGVSRFVISTGLPWPVDKSDWIEGYTLTGIFFQPELVYSPSDRISINGGIHLLKYSSENNFAQVRPVFSSSLKISENTTLRLGSTKGSDSHIMFDPHFNFERLYNDFVEDGFQLTTETDHVFNDAWLGWENYIFKAENEREVFTFGESFLYTSPLIRNQVEVVVPIQVQFKHFGGQISNYPEPVTTFFNMATGIRINYDFDFAETGIEYIRFINSAFPSKPFFLLHNGNASWIRLHAKKGIISLSSSYWNAHDFFAPNGNAIYASVFDFTSNYIVHSRKLITGSASLDYPAADYLKLLLGIDMYYDTDFERMDYAVTLHLDFSKLFELGKQTRGFR